MDALTTLLLVGTLVVITLYLIYYLIREYMPVREEDGLKIVVGSRPRRVHVDLDQVKEDAVEALVRDGWKRTAAVSALLSTGWYGYPDTTQMVQAAWKSMPGYRK